MAETYSQDQAQNTEEKVARKLDGRLIPLLGVGLFLLFALIAAVFMMRRNAPVSTPDAIQTAPVGTDTGSRDR